MNKEESHHSTDNDSSDKMGANDLSFYAKSSCKTCWGRGYLKYVNADGSFLKNDICRCVWKNKNSEELIERLRG